MMMIAERSASRQLPARCLEIAEKSLWPRDAGKRKGRPIRRGAGKPPCKRESRFHLQISGTCSVVNQQRIGHQRRIERLAKPAEWQRPRLFGHIRRDEE